MLLAINGIPLGGLTSQGLDLELEVCGQVVQLVISRYKQSLLPETHVRLMEEQLHSEVDDALNDTYNLEEWVDVFGKRTIPLPETVLTADEPAVAASKTANKAGVVGAHDISADANLGPPTKGSSKTSNL